MLGGLLTLSALALGDALVNRHKGALRNLVFVVVTGASCVVITGLPEEFFPDLPVRLMMVLKAGLGPLAGALALYFLGGWLGGLREDWLVHRLTAWGGRVVLLAAVALSVLATQITPPAFNALLWVTACVNMLPVLLALAAVTRATKRGDPLARWMVLPVVLLAVMVLGLYLRGIGVPGIGLGVWLTTALATVGFFFMSTVLVLLRNRQNRVLARQSRLASGAEPATGLSTGAELLAKVAHAFWRTARVRGECTVVCLHVSNLYELAESAGPGAEHQILVTLAARIRRAAGFRCVVGLYHPRSFVVVISTDWHDAQPEETLARLRSMVAKPLSVQTEEQARQVFVPRLGFGTVTLDPLNASPMDVINEAERQCLGIGDAKPVASEPPGQAPDTERPLEGADAATAANAGHTWAVHTRVVVGCARTNAPPRQASTAKRAITEHDIVTAPAPLV